MVPFPHDKCPSLLLVLKKSKVDAGMDFATYIKVSARRMIRQRGAMLITHLIKLAL
jgi:hypothetical protein